VASIRDLHNPWRDDLLPARFRGSAFFHVEQGAIQSGRRIVVHQFPKRDYPYAEDMGREAREFSVRGYCISFPYDTDIPLYQRDYRVARNILINALEQEGYGELQLPTYPATPQSPIMVTCPSYRVTEEQRSGGYCVIDMKFVEQGIPPEVPGPDGQWAVVSRSKYLRDLMVSTLDGQILTRVAIAKGRYTRAPQGPDKRPIPIPPWNQEEVTETHTGIRSR